MGIETQPPRAESMKSTWRGKSFKEMNRHQKQMEMFQLHPTSDKQEVPVFQKSDPVQFLPHWQGHLWVLYHALWPLAVHQAIIWYRGGKNIHPFAAFLLYAAAYKVNAIHELWMLRDLGMRYGFLDGDKHERDQVPDASATKIMRALLTTSTFRPLMAVFLSYSSLDSLSISPWVVLEIGLYGIVLDLFYYAFHRSMHELDGLWQFHRTHHLTKHPTPLLTIYADTVQETFDIAIVPLATWLTLKYVFGLPMNFPETWLCHQYVVFTELFGHSGIRLRVTPPTTATPLLRFFKAELVTEDHDLHHRKGYRHSHNYGKQTLLWDRLFGTTHERYETQESNVQWDNPASMKLACPFF